MQVFLERRDTYRFFLGKYAIIERFAFLTNRSNFYVMVILLNGVRI